MVPLCHAAASEKKNTGRGPKERCRSVPRGAPSPFLYLRHFSRGDRESGVSLSLDSI